MAWRAVPTRVDLFSNRAVTIGLCPTPTLPDAARAPPAPARRGQLVAAPLEEADDGTLIYARARVDDFKEVRAFKEIVSVFI